VWVAGKIMWFLTNMYNALETSSCSIYKSMVTLSEPALQSLSGEHGLAKMIA